MLSPVGRFALHRAFHHCVVLLHVSFRNLRDTMSHVRNSDTAMNLAIVFAMPRSGLEEKV